MFYARCNVIAQYFILCPPQRGLHRCDLRHDINTIAIFFHHPRDASDLAFDTAQTF